MSLHTKLLLPASLLPSSWEKKKGLPSKELICSYAAVHLCFQGPTQNLDQLLLPARVTDAPPWHSILWAFDMIASWGHDHQPPSTHGERTDSRPENRFSRNTHAQDPTSQVTLFPLYRREDGQAGPVFSLVLAPQSYSHPTFLYQKALGIYIFWKDHTAS